MRTRIVLLVSLAAILGSTFLQAQVSQKIDNAFVQRTFGKDFTLVPEVGGMIGDLDGDGVEDAVIAARCKNPLLDAAEHNYEVIDPYYTFYGYGNPQVSMSFVEDSPSKRGLVVLIIHGMGPDAWRSETVKSKYVVINFPYQTLSVHKMALKKKTVQAIYAEESNELHDTSALFFDGKKYKYVPMGSSME
jgi:hypothetical protein